MHQVLVNNRVKRFVSEGLKGMEMHPGRGRKLIIDTLYLYYL